MAPKLVQTRLSFAPCPSSAPRSTPQNSNQDPGQNAKPEPIPTSSKGTMTITESTGDLFAAPPNTVLIHACNCIGSWGGGIALIFKKKCPNAFKTYNKHCSKNSPSSLNGTALLIPPSEAPDKPQHWIGCVFTSKKYGRVKDSPTEILKATELAMVDLMRQIKEVGDEKIQAVWMCRINSGMFGVKWDRSKRVLLDLDADMGETNGLDVINVVRPVGEPE